MARWCASVNSQVRKVAPCGSYRSLRVDHAQPGVLEHLVGLRAPARAEQAAHEAVQRRWWRRYSCSKARASPAAKAAISVNRRVGVAPAAPSLFVVEVCHVNDGRSGTGIERTQVNGVGGCQHARAGRAQVASRRGHRRRAAPAGSRAVGLELLGADAADPGQRRPASRRARAPSRPASRRGRSRRPAGCARARPPRARP